MVMVWLEGGQGEVRGACVPPTPHTPNRPTWIPPPPHPNWSHLDPPPPPPNRPSRTPPHSPLLAPPPQRDPGQQLFGGVVGVQNSGVAPPPPGVRTNYFGVLDPPRNWRIGMRQLF